MLRRKPTALTVTNEDIAAFEEAAARQLAYARYLKTGQDPEGWFREGRGGPDAQMTETNANAGGAVDPNDELKPLPGDKARIVRGREERIVGTGSNGR
jgi:hypothetical protein